MVWATIGDPRFRPYVFLVATIILLAMLDWDGGRFLSQATAFSTMQSFATLGPVALGLGLTMLIREFDLSVAGMFGLAGCIAVLTGAEHAWLGLLLAVLAGCGFGVVQGVIMTRLNIASVGVTLGGLLTAVGVAYVLTESQSLVYSNMELALALNERVMGIFSPRSIAAVVVVVLAIFVLGFTRLGRDMIATGSDRRAAVTCGVNVDGIVIGTFAFSGITAALAGALLSYSLASASPSGLSDVLVPAAAAAILGGVSLSGGTGTPLGIAAGVLTLAVMRSGLNAIGAPPFAHDIAMGAILLTVAVLDAAHLGRRTRWLRARATRQRR
jgi:ribose/xylose/arabinose/galactoside ABC-type transport system permease subunit